MYILTGTIANQCLMQVSKPTDMLHVMSSRFGMNTSLSRLFLKRFFDNPNFIFIDTIDYVSGRELFNPNYLTKLSYTYLDNMLEEISKIDRYVFVHDLSTDSFNSFRFEYFDSIHINCIALRRKILDDAIAMT